MKNWMFSVAKPTKLGTWNVRTMFQTGKMAQVIREFERYDLDVLALSEVRWTGNGSICTNGTMLLYSGSDKAHVNSVGILLNGNAKKALIGWNPVNERITTAILQSRHSKTTVVAVYAPTVDADEEDKDEFYLQRQDVLNGIRKSDIVILLSILFYSSYFYSAYFSKNEILRRLS
jgi:hypothetical protein